MKTIEKNLVVPMLVVACLGGLCADAVADTVIIANPGGGQNTGIPATFGDRATTSASGSYANAFVVSGTPVGTPSIDLTWSTVQNRSGGATLQWEFHDWGGAVTDDGGALQLNGSEGGTGGTDPFLANDVHQIAFTPDTGAGVILHGFNFVGDTNGDTYRYNWRVVRVSNSQVVASGQTPQWTTDDGQTGRPTWDGAPSVNINYTGATNEALRLEIAQSIGSAGNAVDIAIDNLSFAQFGSSEPPPAFSPYLQSTTKNSITINWHESLSTESIVEYGTTAALGQTTTGDTHTFDASTLWHRVKLTGLQPDTEYFYRCKTGANESGINTFRTFPANDVATGHFRIGILGDTRTGIADHTRVINAMRETVQTRYGTDIQNQLNLVLNVGDIVTTGSSLGQYTTEYFNPIESLAPNVPFMVSIGNHENEAAHYYNYMNYEDFGGPEGEKYYSFRAGSILFLAINSNYQLRNQTQLDWIEAELTAAQADGNVDWVIAFCHHPGRSEVWPDGNTAWVNDSVIPLLANYDKVCGLYYGHSHNFEMGANPDAPFYIMLNGGGGSSLDNWRQYGNQTDYPELYKSWDHFGYTIIDFDLADRSYSAETYSLGNQYKALDNVLIDEFYQKREGTSAPQTPQAVSPSGDTGLPVILTASAYSGVEEIMASHFQVTATSGNYAAPVVDNRRDWVNFYYDTGAPDYEMIDLNAGINLEQLEVASGVSVGQTLHWRVRYRDQNLVWSEWSSEKTFSISSEQASNPVPADQATASANANLSWTTGQSATSHNIYFGTNPTPDASEFQANQTFTLFDPGPLLPETTYYWRVDEIHPGGTTTGAVWRFTGRPEQGAIALLSHFGFDGDTTNSISGQPHGTVTGSATYSTGKFGQAVGFAAYADHVDLGSTTLGGIGANNFTLSIWVNLNGQTVSSDPAFFSNKNWASGTNKGINYCVKAGGNLDVNTYGGQRVDFQDAGTSDLSASSWDNIILVRDGTTLRYYFNGIQEDGDKTITAGATFESALNFILGDDGTGSYNPSGGSPGWTGDMLFDDLAVFDTALGQTDITTLQSSSALTFLSGKDADSDGMPDDWENDHGLNPSADDRSGDPDLDGQDNWFEYVADTNPQDGGSKTIFSFELVPGTGEPSTHFDTSSSRYYAVEYNDDLTSGIWIDLVFFPGTGYETNIVDPTTLPSRFYRLRTKLP